MFFEKSIYMSYVASSYSNYDFFNILKIFCANFP